MFGYYCISNKKIWLLKLFTFFVSIISLHAQEINYRIGSFNNRILVQNGPIKNIYSSPKQVYLDSLFLKKDQVQEFIKTSNANYIVTRGTGFVYRQNQQIDSIWKFSRIDSTQFDGYNFDDIKFAYHDTLFSIGGFGFWRNNGQVRYFTENKEWELLIPEIPYGISRRNYWNLDALKGFLYVIINIKELEYKLIKIDLSNRTWSFEKLPDVILSEVLSINENPMQVQLNNETGSLLCFSNKIVYLNLQDGIVKKPNNDKLLNFVNKYKIRDASYFEAGNKLFVFNDNLISLDSINVEKNDFKLINYNTSIYKNSWSLIILCSLITIIIVSILYRYKKKKKQDWIDLNEFEKELLKILTNKKGRFIDIESLNYILGLSKKSPEIQKKNRSEFLNKLNQKLKEVFNTDDTVIIRVKDEEDKRVFVYQLNLAYFEKIEELL